MVNSRTLALGCVAGPVLFTLAWLVLGFVSPGYEVGGVWISPYSAVTQPISGLGMGDTGPYMNTGFVLGGLLTAAGVAAALTAVVGDRRATVTRALLVLAPLGLTVAGVFTLDDEAPHFAGFGMIAVLPVVGFPLAGLVLRQVPGWRRFGTWSLVAGPVVGACTALFLLTFDEQTAGANAGVAGLTSRVLAVVVVAWYAAFGWRTYRSAT